MATATNRARIASVVSSLRRLTPRVPFWQLAAHRIPTLWTLYRGLLRNAPSEIVRNDVGWKFRRYRYVTSPSEAKERLKGAHRWLDVFVKAKQGDTRLRAILQRYTRMLEAKRDKDRFAQMLRDELTWQQKLSTSPRLTGSFLKPSLYNRPLPRLKPQPILLTGMLNRRRKSRERRYAQMEVLTELRQDLKRESEFEKSLERTAGGRFEKVMAESAGEMDRHIHERLATIRCTFQRDLARLQSPYTPELLATVRAARQFKVQNKTREREREERGEVLLATERRARKRPPPSVLWGMSERERRLDVVARSGVSEVGYVGKVKRMLGWKLKRPEAWKAEAGAEGEQERLEMLERRIREKNEKKRRVGEDRESQEGAAG